MKRWMLATTLLILGAALPSVAADAPDARKDKPKTEVTMAFDQPPAAGTRAKCPVSKEVFTVSDQTARSEHKGKHYVFCCPDCKPQFDEKPTAFLQTAQTPASGAHH